MNTHRVILLKEIVNQAFNLNVDNRSRKTEYVVARAMCYKILKEHSSMTSSFIGRQFNKTHATILHGLEEFPWMVKADRLNLALIEVQEQVALLSKDNKRCLSLVKKIENTVPETRLKLIEKKIYDIINGFIWLQIHYRGYR